MEKMVIAMTTDNNYIIPTKVAIYSMWKSTPAIYFEIHILCNDKLDNKNREKLVQLADRLNRMSIVFDEVKDKVLDGANTLGHIPVASYYRLFICRFFDSDRCLFIDGDMLINANLSDLYNINMEGYYIAGVRDCAVQSKNTAFANHEIELGIPDMHQYVNAGFMLFNLKKIREDNLDNLFVDAISNGYRYMDQDIINKFCYGKIKHLPLRYNLFGEFYGRLEKLNGTDFSKEEIEGAVNWAVLHYPGGYKPWICSRLKANQIWWMVAIEALSKKEYATCCKLVKEYERVSDWSYIYDKVNGYTNVVIFGYSQIGCELENRLRKTMPKISIVFADNDPNKQGLIHEGNEVLSAKEAVRECALSCWLISSQVAHSSIKQQLLELGIKKEQIVRYIYKTDAYYEGLDEENYKYEMKILENN